MQKDTPTTTNDEKKQPVEEAVQDKGKAPAAASPPANKPKSREDLAVEDFAEYYANSEPPGRRYPTSMADDMLSMFIDGDMPEMPVIKKTDEAGKKNESDEDEK